METNWLRNWIDSELEHCVTFLEQLVGINSCTGNVTGINAVQSELEAHFSEMGFATERSKTEQQGDILIASIGDTRKKGILLSGHVDTVYPVDSPFQAVERKGDRLIGPGTVDMKGGLVVILWALRALHAHGSLGSVPITVVFNPDEEIGSPESAELLIEYARKAACVLVFEAGRAGNSLITQRRGIMQYELEVQGRATHAGNAHRQGANAIVQLAHTILKLAAYTDYERGITCNVGKIRGGTAFNIVPKYAAASFEVRMRKLEDYRDLSRQLADELRAIEVEGTQMELKERFQLPPMEERPDIVELYERFSKAAAKLDIEYSRSKVPIGGGSNANDVAPLGIPTLDGLGPLGGEAHSEREYLELSSLKPKIASLAYWLATDAADYCASR